MSNRTVRISDRLIQWEDEKDPLAPLSSSQTNAYLRLSEHLANTDFTVCMLDVTITVLFDGIFNL